MACRYNTADCGGRDRERRHGSAVSDDWPHSLVRIPPANAGRVRDVDPTIRLLPMKLASAEVERMVQQNAPWFYDREVVFAQV